MIDHANLIQQIRDLALAVDTTTKSYDFEPTSTVEDRPNGMLIAAYRNAFHSNPSVMKFEGLFDLKVLEHLQGAVVYQYSNLSQEIKDDDFMYSSLSRVVDMEPHWVKYDVTFDSAEEVIHSNLRIKDITVFHDPRHCMRNFADIIDTHRIEQNSMPSMGIIKQGGRSLYIEQMEISNAYDHSDDNYNEDFPEFLENITERLSEQQSGLYLLHGDPGTGKSSAIRHIIKLMKGVRKFVYVPPHMIHSLALPEFADLLTGDCKRSVLVIEDAEKALLKRDNADGFHNSDLVSSVLNLTDGLYADITKTAIIATYNCDRNMIDDALLRKGRLKVEYRFNKLEAQRAQALAIKLGKSMDITEPTSLADIYNEDLQYSNNDKPVKQRAVGFGSR